jgi:hypothetical protein
MFGGDSPAINPLLPGAFSALLENEKNGPDPRGLGIRWGGFSRMMVSGAGVPGIPRFRQEVPRMVHGRVALTVACLVAPVALGQADFETAAPACGAVSAFPAPCGAAGGPEGVSWNAAPGALFAPNTDTANGVGMPTTGSQYCRVSAKGPFAVPVGGPAPEPTAGACAQLYIPIPGGSTSVSFYWDFYNLEGPQPHMYNDGVSIDFVGAACGPSIGNLVYADTGTTLGPGGDLAAPCSSGGQEVLGGGPQTISSAPVPVGAVYIRVSVWNGFDNDFISDCAIDSVTFNAPPPPPACALVFSSPFGPGSVQMDNTACPGSGGNSYLSAITLSPGATPNGWWYGLDISFAALVAQYQTGLPFAGTLSAAGSSTAGPFGPAAGLSGLTLNAVTVEFAPGFGAVVAVRPLTSYTIP